MKKTIWRTLSLPSYAAIIVTSGLLISLPVDAQSPDVVRVTADGNRVVIDTGSWGRASSVAPLPAGFSPAIRLLTGGARARVETDAGCIARQVPGMHRGRHYLHVEITPACLDGRRLPLTLTGAPLRRVDRTDNAIEAAGKSDEFERQWLNLTFANYDPATDPGSAVSDAPAAPAAVTFTGSRLRVEISTPGIYRLTRQQMVNAGFTTSIDPTALKLTRAGVELPIMVVGAFTLGTDYLEFYGEPLLGESTPCDVGKTGAKQCAWENGDNTDTEHYFLTQESGGRLRTAVLPLTVQGFALAPDLPVTVRREINDNFIHYVEAAGETHFYEKVSLVVKYADQNVTVPFTIATPFPVATQPGPVRVRVHLRGFYSPPWSIHAVAFKLNGLDPVAVQQNGQPYSDWTGAAFQTFVLDFPAAAITAATPTSTLDLKMMWRNAGNGGIVEKLMDWIEVDYQKNFVAAGNRLVFGLPNQDNRVQISGLSLGAAGLLLYETTPGRPPVRFTGFGVAGGTLTADFPVDVAAPATRTFLLQPLADATIDETPPKPTVIFNAPDPALAGAQPGAKYLILYHPELVIDAAASAWNTFLTRKQTDFGAANVRAIPIQDVYNEFSLGRFDPEALHRLLAEARGNWLVKPDHVLLLGDATYDPKDYYNRKAPTVESTYKNWVPTRNIDLPQNIFYGFWNTDAGLTDVDDDGIADLAIGRIPSRTPAETNVLLGKLNSYANTAGYANWMGQTLLSADIISGGIYGEFVGASRNYTAATPAPQKTVHLFYSEAPYFGDAGNNSALYVAGNGTTGGLRPCMNGASCIGNDGSPTTTGGFNVINFIGHGDQSGWGSHTLFTIIGMERNSGIASDIALLSDATPSAFTTVFNCLSGTFTSPRNAGAANNTDFIVEAALKKSGGGFVHAMAPTALTELGFSTLQMTGFNQALNGELKIRQTGLLQQALRMTSTNYLANFSSILFGDPAQSLKLPAPPPPAGLLATAGNAQVSLSWTSPVPAVQYVRIWRATQSSGGPLPRPANFSPLVCLPRATLNYLDSAVSNATTYHYLLSGYDGNGGAAANCGGFEGARGASVNATPLNPNPPATPTGVIAADPGNGTSLDVSFTGVGNPDLSFYTLHWGTVAGSPAFSLAIGKSTSVRVGGLTQDVRYYFSVSATNTSLLTSPRSAEASATPRQTYGGIRPPAPVTDLRISKAGADLRLDWTPVALNMYGDPLSPALSGQTLFRADAAAGYNFNVFNFPRGGQPLDMENSLGAAVATFTNTGAAGGTASFAYLIMETSPAGDSSAGAGLPRGVNDLTFAKSAVTPGRLNFYFTPVTLSVTGLALPVPPVYWLYRSVAPAPVALDRSGAHSGAIAQLTGAFCEGTARYCNDTDLSSTSSFFYALLTEDHYGNSSPW